MGEHGDSFAVVSGEVWRPTHAGFGHSGVRDVTGPDFEGDLDGQSVAHRGVSSPDPGGGAVAVGEESSSCALQSSEVRVRSDRVRYRWARWRRIAVVSVMFHISLVSLAGVGMVGGLFGINGERTGHRTRC